MHIFIDNAAYILRIYYVHVSAYLANKLFSYSAELITDSAQNISAIKIPRKLEYISTRLYVRIIKLPLNAAWARSLSINITVRIIPSTED